MVILMKGSTLRSWSINRRLYLWLGFPSDSDGKESTCNTGDLGLISGLGRCPGEGNGYPVQYSWASLVAQMVRICLQCRRPGLGRHPGGGHGNPLQCSCLENPMDRGAWRAIVHEVAQRHN